MLPGIMLALGLITMNSVYIAYLLSQIIEAIHIDNHLVYDQCITRIYVRR